MRCRRCSGCLLAGLFGNSCFAYRRVDDRAPLARFRKAVEADLAESASRVSEPVVIVLKQPPLAAVRELRMLKLCYKQAIGLENRLAWKKKVEDYVSALSLTGYDVPETERNEHNPEAARQAQVQAGEEMLCTDAPLALCDA